MQIILFGQPGSGKNYIGRLLKKEFGFFFYDADLDLTEELEEALSTDPKKITDKMREEYYNIVKEKFETYSKDVQNIVMAQALPKEKYRQFLHKHFPNAYFIFLKADDEIMNKRLEHKKHFIHKTQGLKIRKFFDAPEVPHISFSNNEDNREKTIRELKKLLNILKK